MNGINEYGPIIPGEKTEFDHGDKFLNFRSPFMFGKSSEISSLLN